MINLELGQKIYLKFDLIKFLDIGNDVCSFSIDIPNQQLSRFTNLSRLIDLINYPLIQCSRNRFIPSPLDFFSVNIVSRICNKNGRFYMK